MAERSPFAQAIRDQRGAVSTAKATRCAATNDTLRKIAREAEERLAKTIRDAQKMKRGLYEMGEKPR